MNYKKHSLASVLLENIKANPNLKKMILIGVGVISVFLILTVVAVFWLMSFLWNQKDVVAQGLSSGAQVSSQALNKVQAGVSSQCGQRLQKNWQQLLAGDIFVILNEAEPLWNACVVQTLQGVTGQPAHSESKGSATETY